LTAARLQESGALLHRRWKNSEAVGAGALRSGAPRSKGMSIGLILLILLVIFLLGGFSGRFGGYGYGYGHGGIGVIGVIVIVLVVLLLMGRL